MGHESGWTAPTGHPCDHPDTSRCAATRSTRDARRAAEALTLAAADPDIDRVELRGEGDAFCAGGDLDEFGTRPDPATAHVIRLERSIGRMLARLRTSRP